MSTTATESALSPAVNHCLNAYHQAYAAERGKGTAESECQRTAIAAYRNSMPCLADLAAIRGFIACVTYGMVAYIIPNDDATKLLYAANVAFGAYRRERPTKLSVKPETQKST
jgi:hypothetical protein